MQSVPLGSWKLSRLFKEVNNFIFLIIFPWAENRIYTYGRVSEN